MLCLSRKIGESLIVTIPPSDKEQTIEIKTQYVRGNRAGIAVGADRRITILRKELKDSGEVVE